MSCMAHSALLLTSPDTPLCSPWNSLCQAALLRSDCRASPAETESGLPASLVVQTENAEEKVALNERY